MREKRTSFRAETFHTPAVAKAIPATQIKVLLRQFEGRVHHPPIKPRKGMVSFLHKDRTSVGL